jgi:hypothetical protein
MFNLTYSKITASDMAAGIFLCTNFLHPISIGKTVVSDHRAHFPKKPTLATDVSIDFYFLLTAMWILSYPNKEEQSN